MTQLAYAPPSAGPLPGSPGCSLEAATRALNAWVEVDLDALQHNVDVLSAAVAPAALIAVVKANAYGAGVAGVAPALERAGIGGFAVAWAAEAVELRALGIGGPIIVLGHVDPADAAVLVESDITTMVDSLALGRALSRAAVERGMVARVHLNVDTGLHRDGVTPEEAVALADALRALPGIDVEGLSTHMANADEADDSYSAAQHERFARVFEQLSWIRYRHTANSATALRRPEWRFDAIRSGIALHGIVPENTSASALRPILQLKARIARVVEVEAGEGTSYGLTWRAGRPSRLALVPVGYADGWRRALGNHGEVLIAGRRCPMVGRVCMDQFLVDITDLPGVEQGAETVLLGRQGSETITADDIAAQLDTIPWEVISALLPRVPRVFVRDGMVEQIA